jgi:hypothetical protein
MSETPMRSSTRAAAALMDGASAGCTQPRSATIFLAWRGAGQAPAREVFGAILTSCPSRNAAVNSAVRGRPNESAARRSRSHGERRTRRST